ncbi:hypothetical protein AB664_23445 [Brucella anthropi]|uniref:Uncharacterized protein n=1 Tax=Brucella anthropi TaxID=529 RepID=A0A656Z6J8_BRUAN|nr:hypothetical protein AB664_23445 [Brucella anthropi]
MYGSEIERDESLTTTVSSSGVSMPVMVLRLLLRELLDSGAATRSMENLTSFEVSGAPEWNLTPG